MQKDQHTRGYGRQNTVPSRHNPSKFIFPPPSLGKTPGQKMSQPNWQVEEMNTDLPKVFSFLDSNFQQPPRTNNQPWAKGPENSLFSQYEKKLRPYIDLIDSLRSLGVEQDLALPAIAVIGDQSSGKSSVLEALSGVTLPRGSGIVTRCPLVLKLKKQQQEQVWAGRISYRNIEQQLENPTQVEKEIYKAQNIIAGRGLGISHELINLEITSPEVPDLTIIDLPGIARVAVGDQPQDIGDKIKALIMKYIEKQQTIKLVVVPCNVDIATTEALRMAQEVDPEGDRTIGILTKPDLVDRGTEQVVMNVVRNFTYPLKKGYVIVKCRGQQEVTDKLSLAEATSKERMFFERHSYFSVLLEESLATVPHLAERLTAELIFHIKKSLPLLEKQIRDSHQRAIEELRRCGTEIPMEEASKMSFLIEMIKAFNQDIEKLVEGEEAVWENENRLYNRVREEFKTWVPILETNIQKVKNFTYEEFEKYEKQYRGKELLGFNSYKTFEIIVHKYIQQLVDPALSMLHKVVEIVRQAFSDTAQKNFSEFFNLNQEVQKKIEDFKVIYAEKAQDIIQLQFKMENTVFCQDCIYSLILKNTREDVFQSLANLSNSSQFNSSASNNQTLMSSIIEISVHLHSYFQEMARRLANQIPFIIQYFMLRENGDCLQKNMMHILQDKDRYSWLLQEQSETATKRKFLKDRISRLTKAQQTLHIFSLEEFTEG
ncbi:interferon-induced GTP-binding protein Mx2-like [Carlito syrichta]|uniref:Interferon-induced GTP-binding protein Mx2 n=1 Tax=Carlito syrichta TaxID=1868482 RepID=A0A3Q0E524_CARSF|nr:interferon-induced GTP-binding protein Mx2-like [Carlito syrichta]